jgi:hypothetical protein
MEADMSEKKRVAVMFSGGTDSTFAAVSEIPKYDEIQLIIQLITFIRDGLRKLENPDGIVERLCKAFPGKEILYKQISNEDIYQKLTPHKEKLEAHRLVLSQKIGPLWEDPHGKNLGREKYDSDKVTLFMTNECLQCKIAMHIAAIKYCKEPQEKRGDVLFKLGITDHINHKQLEKAHQIPSTQVQCTVPSSVLWTICIFPWLVYDGQSCNEYVDMCCNYYEHEMEKGLKAMNLEP